MSVDETSFIDDADEGAQAGVNAALDLSHSQVDTFTRCPQRWWLVKRTSTARAPSEMLILGQAAHHAIEVDIRQQLAAGEPMELAALTATFAEALAQMLQQEDPQQMIAPERRALLSQQGSGVIAAYRAEVAPHLHPVAVEVPFDFTHPDDPSIHFRGRLDAITQTVGEQAKRTIVDWKVTQRPWPIGAEHQRQQAAAYRWAESCMGWEPSQRVTFVTFPPRDPFGADLHDRVVDSRPTAPDAARLADYAQLVQRTAKQIGAMEATGVFPARPSALCAWCEVRGACPTGRDFVRNRGLTLHTPTLPQ